MDSDPVRPVAPREDELQAPSQHIIDLAVEVSGWSPCRSKRGVVIFDGDDVLSHGYNYKPRGFDCDGSDACKATCRNEAVHAEQQALLLLGRRSAGMDMLHVKTVNGKLVPSGGPSCVQCSKLALVCGISGVWLFHENGWRRYDTADFHQRSIIAAAPVPCAASPADPEALAQRFHETYERLAPSFGYETRKASAKPWAEVPEQNRNLMNAVCAELLRATGEGAQDAATGLPAGPVPPVAPVEELAAVAVSLDPHRLLHLARQAALDAHTQAITCSEDYLGHRDDMADETHETLGFPTCPHSDCVLVRTNSPLDTGPLPMAVTLRAWETEATYYEAKPDEPVHAHIGRTLRTCVTQMRRSWEFELARLRGEATVRQCVWTFTSDFDNDVWEAACGESWVFIDGGPSDNKARFCHGCGGQIVPVIPATVRVEE